MITQVALYVLCNRLGTLKLITVSFFLKSIKCCLKGVLQHKQNHNFKTMHDVTCHSLLRDKLKEERFSLSGCNSASIHSCPSFPPLIFFPALPSTFRQHRSASPFGQTFLHSGVQDTFLLPGNFWSLLSKSI